MILNKKLHEIEKQFSKKGYYIFDIKKEHLKELNYLKNKLINQILKKFPKIKKNHKKDINIFENIHRYVSHKQLNDFRLGLISSINKDKNFANSYYLAAKEGLDTLVGNEIAIQKKLNLSIQVPNDSESNLPMHSDIYAGESPFEVVVWIPLMNVLKSSHSMFITTPKYNKSINHDVTYKKNTTIDQIYKKHKKKFKFLKITFGQVLIFSPILLHGNIVNKTDITRVSLNCRFKSLLSPYDVFSKTHRNIPHFFRPLNTKVLTKVGFNFINAVNEKKNRKN